MSNFEPRLLAQWTVGTHRKGPVEWKSNFQNELANQKFDPNSKLDLAYKQHYDVKPITPFHLQYFFTEQKTILVPWNDHIIMEFS